MTPFRQNQIAEKRKERLQKCVDQQAALTQVEGSVTATCVECGQAFWQHKQGRSNRCCGCRVAHKEKMQNKWTDSYKPVPGYPTPAQFQEESEIIEYFGHYKLTCLECGHAFRGLQQHINHMHLMSAADYKVKFGIPLGYGLVGTGTKEKLQAYAATVTAKLTAEEKDERVRRMRAAHPLTGGIASTQPVIKKKRAATVKKMLASENRINRTVSGTTLAPCSVCGVVYEVAAWSAVTNPCRIQCKKCRNQKAAKAKAEWAKRNPDLVKQYYIDYRARLKAQGVLQELDKKKWQARKQKKLAATETRKED
jgi:DNA-directed RNA polymerase subunit RPC12/RpoP